MGECRKTPGEYECAVLNATVRRMVLGRVVIATVSAVVFAACSGGDSSVSSADAQSLADIRTLDAGAWRDLQRLDYADPVITRQCGHKDTKRQSATTVASSPVLGYWPSDTRNYMDQGGPDPAVAQLTVAVYPNAGAAAAAAKETSEGAFGDCILSAIERYDRSNGVNPAENEFRQANGRKPRSDIKTESTKSDANGQPVRIRQARFSDEILGGTDNSHDIVETIGQSGRVVVTLYYVTNSQQGDPSGTRAIAKQLTARALKRVGARS